MFDNTSVLPDGGLSHQRMNFGGPGGGPGGPGGFGGGPGGFGPGRGPGGFGGFPGGPGGPGRFWRPRGPRGMWGGPRGSNCCCLFYALPMMVLPFSALLFWAFR